MIRNPVRVHLADDHAMFREGLAAILVSRQNIEVVGQTGTGPEAAEEIGNTKPDVVITQLEMRLKDTEEVLSGIRAASPGSRIVVLTMMESVRYMRAVSKMGIDVLLHKTSSAEEVIATVETLSQTRGERNAVVPMPRTLIERLGEEEEMGGLSAREAEVLVLVGRGQSNDQIASSLHLSGATVKRHLANIYAKIGVRSRHQAVRKALREQWIGVHEISPGDESTDGSR